MWSGQLGQSSRSKYSLKALVASVILPVLLLASCAPLPSLPPEAAAESGHQEEDSNGGEGIQPYEDVITSEASTEEGLFKVHQVGKEYYFEIPVALLGRDMLWHVEIAAAPTNLTVGHEINRRLVRWERRGDTVFVRDLSMAIGKRAGDGAPGLKPKDGAELGVAQVTTPGIMAAFPIAAEGKDGALVIDVSTLFAADMPEFSPYVAFGYSGYSIQTDSSSDNPRNYIEAIKAFPRNIEVRNVLTFSPSTSDEATDGSSATVGLRHAITLLPDEAMMPRYGNKRVGYFTVDYEDYSYGKDNGVVNRSIIERYRLVKQDPSADVSEPVAPIVFYLSPAVPGRWRKYIKAGVEAWQPALEAAGFKKAIVARDAPSAEVDPDWSPFDSRYSVIHWDFSADAYGLAHTVADPRSGEILFSRIYLTGNILRDFSMAYFVQAGAQDVRAQKLPLPDELSGELLRAIVEHEVGHTLGLTHNFKASQAYTTEQLRDPAFTKKNGITASIMAYAGYNYVSQPGDGVTTLVDRIGPYDAFAIKWGYTPIPAAQSPTDELATLDEWASEQLKNPWLAYDSDADADDDDNDPTVLRFNLGANRLESAQLGMKNLESSLLNLLTATVSLGGDYDTLASVYETILDARAQYLVAAAKVPGGVVEQRALGGRGDAEFVPVPAYEQRAAVRFLLENLRVPRAYIRTDVNYRIRPVNVTASLGRTQEIVLNTLLRAQTYRALADAETANPAQAYTLMAYLSDIRSGVWEELGATDVAVEPMRRALQRHYLNVVEDQLGQFKRDAATSDERLIAWFFGTPSVDGTDFRAVARAELRGLLSGINGALPRAGDDMTRAHLEDARDQIERLLKV